MASKRKHNSCSLQTKLQVLNRLDKGESAMKLASEFGVGKATISDWKKNRAKIEQFCEKSSINTHENRLTSKVSKYEKLDEALLLWFSQERDKGVPLSGPLIQEKALHLNKMLNGDPSFTASNGWLDRWKQRHGIRQLTITGEKMSADSAAAKDYITIFDKLIKEENYSPQQVYNCDETGLNFKALPTKSLASKEESRAPGFKMSKERLTVLACSNASGNHKLPLMVIGKSRKPRAFKNINVNSLPVYYRHQNKAWMDSYLFKEWFENQFVPAVKKFNIEHDLPDRALLLVDNAPSHPSEGKLCDGEIKTIFLPPNVTSLVQPMDQGVLQNIKRGYKKMFLRSLIEDEGSESLSLSQKLKKVTVKDVIYWVAEAWDNVTENSLRKSWRQLWPSLSFVEHHAAMDTDEILQLLKTIPGCEGTEENDVNGWLSSEDVGHQLFTDEEIVSRVLNEPEHDSSSEESDSDAPPSVTHSEAVVAFETALRYVEQHRDSTAADVIHLRRWLRTASSARFSSSRQTKMEDFFNINQHK